MRQANCSWKIIQAYYDRAKLFTSIYATDTNKANPNLLNKETNMNTNLEERVDNDLDSCKNLIKSKELLQKSQNQTSGLINEKGFECQMNENRSKENINDEMMIIEKKSGKKMPFWGAAD